MSTSNTAALLVVDVQEAVVRDAWERDRVIARINHLIERARAEHVSVVWIQHHDEDSEDLARGSAGWAVHRGVDGPRTDEQIVEKTHGDAFEGTELARVLGGLGVGRLVVVGAETDACIRSTIHGAFARGYDVTLVADAHTATDKTAWGAPPVADVIAHLNLCWSFQTGEGKTADVAESVDVDFESATPT